MKNFPGVVKCKKAISVTENSRLKKYEIIKVLVLVKRCGKVQVSGMFCEQDEER